MRLFYSLLSFAPNPRQQAGRSLCPIFPGTPYPLGSLRPRILRLLSCLAPIHTAASEDEPLDTAAVITGGSRKEGPTPPEFGCQAEECGTQGFGARQGQSRPEAAEGLFSLHIATREQGGRGSSSGNLRDAGGGAVRIPKLLCSQAPLAC